MDDFAEFKDRSHYRSEVARKAETYLLAPRKPPSGSEVSTAVPMKTVARVRAALLHALGIPRLPLMDMSVTPVEAETTPFSPQQLRPQNLGRKNYDRPTPKPLASNC